KIWKGQMDPLKHYGSLSSSSPRPSMEMGMKTAEVTRKTANLQLTANPVSK
ncbi:mCG145962, partial [Mus musculus]